MIDQVEKLRWRGIVGFTLCGWLITIGLLFSALWLGDLAIEAALVSAMINILPSICVAMGNTGKDARLLIGILAALQPAALVYAVQGIGYQVDMHLYFFVSLAALSALCDLRPLITAATIIVAHHTLLAVVMPSWVFSSEGAAGRVAIHAITTIAMTLVLCVVSRAIRKTMEEVDQAHSQAEEQSELLAEQSAELQQALQRVELERVKREESEEKRETQRAQEVARIVGDFESSIASVIQAVGSTAQVLGQTTKQLEEIAKATGDQASDFATSAASAARSADTVARGVGELTDSISKIAVNVSQQDELTTHATSRAVSGGEVLGSLTQHSDTIGEATRAIVRIAEKTNLLSLNAAIEAATAGPAGRGFTIVAQEVKALAKQASEAATQIDDFLSGVRSGTLQAERSFKEIDEAVAELDQAAKAIRWDVDDQRRAADTIENYAKNAASEVSTMAENSKALAASASSAKQLSSELDAAASALLANIRRLEGSTEHFVANLKAA